MSLSSTLDTFQTHPHSSTTNLPASGISIQQRTSIECPFLSHIHHHGQELSHGSLPAEVRNQIVDEVIVPQPLLLRITNGRPLLGEEPNNLAITQVCRLARQHRDQIRTSTHVPIVACKRSLMYETQRLDRSVLLLDQVKSNVKPGFLTLENHNTTEVDLWIGSLAMEPAPESEQPGLSHERGVHTRRETS